MTYTRTETVEAMQWHGSGEAASAWCDDWRDSRACAERIVAWINEHGGNAHYMAKVFPARIAVRTVDGWAYASPGDWIVLSDHWFNPDPLGGTVGSGVRAFRVVRAADWAAQGWSS